MLRVEMDVDSPNNHNAKTPRALSKGQERKVINFLEDSFQDVESSFKKRCAISRPVVLSMMYPRQSVQSHPSANCPH
ncbi:hypothetical protein EV363DRAFT_1169096 [Boletus edulis]|nr:hypothetical protein EV363DRAFT_1169096 [Boletus edulis]